MDRKAFEKKLAHRTGLSQADAHNIVTIIIEIIGSELRAGRTLSIAGFGTFLTHLRPAGKYKDKITGAAIDYAEELKPYFKASKAFKDRINVDAGNANYHK